MEATPGEDAVKTAEMAAKDLVKVKCKSLHCVRLFMTPQTMESMEFSRPEYWSG